MKTEQAKTILDNFKAALLGYRPETRLTGDITAEMLLTAWDAVYPESSELSDEADGNCKHPWIDRIVDGETTVCKSCGKRWSISAA